MLAAAPAVDRDHGARLGAVDDQRSDLGQELDDGALRLDLEGRRQLGERAEESLVLVERLVVALEDAEADGGVLHGRARRVELRGAPVLGEGGLVGLLVGQGEALLEMGLRLLLSPGGVGAGGPQARRARWGAAAAGGGVGTGGAVGAGGAGLSPWARATGESTDEATSHPGGHGSKRGHGSSRRLAHYSNFRVMPLFGGLAPAAGVVGRALARGGGVAVTAVTLGTVPALALGATLTTADGTGSWGETMLGAAVAVSGMGGSAVTSGATRGLPVMPAMA